MNYFRDLNIGEFLYVSSVGYSPFLKTDQNRVISMNSQDIIPVKYYLHGNAGPFKKVLI